MDVTVPDELVSDPLLVCRVDGTIDHVNHPARRAFGAPDHVSDLDVEPAPVADYLARAVRSTGMTPGRVRTAVTSDEPRSWLAWARRASAADGRVVVRLEDAERTSFRKLSRQLDTLHEEIARRVAAESQLHELVTDTLVRLERANAALSRYATSVAHDLRSPLVAIRGFAGLLPETTVEEDAELTRGIIRNADRALEMVDGLLAESVAPETPEEVDLSGVAAWAVDALGGSIRETGATVVVGDLPTVVATRASMRHVLFNLVRNALQHRRPGAQPLVELSAERQGATWRLVVADDGPGVPADEREHIFEAGVRLHPEASEGHGLGLASCRSAVRDLGGDIHVEESTRGGARFVVTLPAAPA